MKRTVAQVWALQNHERKKLLQNSEISAMQVPEERELKIIKSRRANLLFALMSSAFFWPQAQQNEVVFLPITFH